MGRFFPLSNRVWKNIIADVKGCYIYHFYTRSEGDSAKYYPKWWYFQRSQPEGNIIIEGKISPNPPNDGYRNALLYRKNTWIKKKFVLQNKQSKFRLFGELERRCLRVVTTNDILPHIPRSKPYTMVIFPAAFIYHAYEEDSGLNRMLKWYKVISVIGQSKFEV